MNTDALPLDDETQIYCNIRLHGWSDFIVCHHGEPQVFRISDVFTDFPNEMLAICRAVLEGSSLRVALCDEPGGVVLEVVRDQKQQHTTILTVYEIDKPILGFLAGAGGKAVLSTRIRRQRLVGTIMAELWKTHVGLKHPSFQKGRSDFPHRELRELNTLWNNGKLGPSFLTE